MPNNATTKIDKLIFAFVVIFAASLTNSIFVNQIGYYGALILLLYKYYSTKQNPFRSTNLEYYFLFFLVAELLSSIFSVDPSHSFNNFLKRLLLIPVVYVVTAVLVNPRRVSKIFFVFLTFSILSSVIYLWNSYSFYLRGLFQLTGSGPFLFHYPITTSELFSFTALILLAFVIQKNMTFKKRTLYSLGFLITILSLLATFKRTGWIGFAAGALIVIILKKDYIYLLPIALLIAFVAFTQKSVSSVEVFSKSKKNRTVVLNTPGQIHNLSLIDNTLYAADYTEGIEKVSGNKIEKELTLNAPVISVKKWNDKYLVANLIDTRFVLLGRSGDSLVPLQTFMSKGMTKDYAIYKNNLYVLDSDSGLTVFTNPDDLLDTKEIKNVTGFYKLITAGEQLYVFSKSKGIYQVIVNENNELQELKHFLPSKRLLFATGVENELYLQTEDSLFIAYENIVIKRYNSDLEELIYLQKEDENKLFAATLGGTFYEIDLGESLKHNKLFNIGYNPKSIIVRGDSIITAHLKTSRLASIFDPHLPANANRFALWRAGLKMFSDYPLFGVGDIDLAELYKQYKRPFDKEIQGHLHNNYIHFLAILGIFGTVAVLLLLIRIFVLLLKAISRFKPNTFEHTLALGFTGVYISFLVAGLTEWNFGDHEIITFIWFSVGMTLSLRKLKID